MNATAATLMAAVALGVACYAVLRPPPAPTPAICDHSGLEQELGRLRGRLAVAEREITDRVELARARDDRTNAAAATGDADEPPPDATTAESGAPPPTTRRYTAFRAPAGVRVRQTENGALAVENNDAARTHQIEVIEAVREDGTVDNLTITLPPPGS